MDRWCESRGVQRGATITIDQAWALSLKWYGNRMDPSFRRPTIDEAHAIFASVGLTGDFWTLS